MKMENIAKRHHTNHKADNSIRPQMSKSSFFCHALSDIRLTQRQFVTKIHYIENFHMIKHLSMN